MKKLIYPVLAVALAFLIQQGVDAQPTINNPGFENWQNLGTSTEEPTDWNSFKSASGTLAGLAAQQVKRSTVVRAGANGSYSALIWSRSVLGIVANGNLTTGQINMESTTASDPSNYNITRTANPDFSEALGGKPDSIVFWAKFVPAGSSGNDSARMHAVIHDTYDYRDPPASDPNALQHMVGEATLNFPSTQGAWKRFSVPFDYSNGQASSPDFILLTFATNKNPGGGSGGDSLYIDDVEFIFNNWGIEDKILGGISGIRVEQTRENLIIYINNPKSPPATISVYNLAGQLILKSENNAGGTKKIIDTRGMKKGMYFVDVIRSGEPRFMQKFTVR